VRRLYSIYICTNSRVARVFTSRGRRRPIQFKFQSPKTFKTARAHRGCRLVSEFWPKNKGNLNVCQRQPKKSRNPCACACKFFLYIYIYIIYIMQRLRVVKLLHPHVLANYNSTFPSASSFGALPIPNRPTRSWYTILILILILPQVFKHVTYMSLIRRLHVCVVWLFFCVDWVVRSMLTLPAN
jgi:hypothetical protein